MKSLLIVVCLMAMAADGTAERSAEDQAVYETVAAAAGRNADAHVRLALWCEARGRSSERARHLALAVMIDPNHTGARGLLGHVRDGSKWRRPEELAARAQEDPERRAVLAEYEAKRAEVDPTADDQWKLALW